MSGDITIDARELAALARNLGDVGGDVVDEVRKVMKKGAQNMKDEMVADVQGSPHFKGMAGSISYDEVGAGDAIEFEVGPDKGRRGGALGNIYYFGTSRGGGSGDIDKPIASESPRLESALGALLGQFGGRL